MKVGEVLVSSVLWKTLQGPLMRYVHVGGGGSCGALDGGTPMSHVDLKKWQLSLIFRKVMSLSPMSYV